MTAEARGGLSGYCDLIKRDLQSAQNELDECMDEEGCTWVEWYNPETEQTELIMECPLTSQGCGYEVLTVDALEQQWWRTCGAYFTV